MFILVDISLKKVNFIAKSKPKYAIYLTFLIPATENNNIAQREQGEMAAVGGNISAVFIVRAFHERAEALQRLTAEATEMVAAQAHSKDHPHLMKMLADSKLTDRQMAMLREDLFGALNNVEETNGKKYLNELAHFLEALGPKKGLKSDKEKKKAKSQKKGIKGERIMDVNVFLET
jgi:hypothetical protein